MTMLVKRPETAFDREIVWRNPDAPAGSSQAVFRFPYCVRSGEQSWGEFQERLAQLSADRFFLVSEITIPAGLRIHVAHQVGEVAPCVPLIFQGKEETKTLLTVSALLEQALKAAASRASVIIALGGGLVGNVAGLVAGLLFRGIRFVQLPTTLLAMSDSVLSLKQGVNSSLGKNHAGLFVAPQIVWANLDLLATLPLSEMRAALCELIKNICVLDASYLDEVAGMLRFDATYNQAQQARFIDLCIAMKGAVMANDALEKHEALALEYGHTIGHALELAAPGKLSHGLAVGLGLLVEAWSAYHLGLLSRADLQTHYALLRANGAPVQIPPHPAYETENLFRYVEKDNKRGYLPPIPGTYPMVVLDGLGRPHRTAGTALTPVGQAEIAAALSACR